MNKQEIMKLIDSCKQDLKSVTLHAMSGKLSIDSALKLESVREALNKIANNGYRTQMLKEKKPNSTSYAIYVEYSK